MQISFEFGPYIPHVFGDAAVKERQSHIGWVIAAVSTSVAWPKIGLMVTYEGDQYHFYNSGIDGKKTPCLAIPYVHGNEQSVTDQAEKLYRFASILGWFMGGYVDVVGHITSTAPVGYGHFRSDANPVTYSDRSFDCNFMPIVSGQPERRALAFWREGETLRSVHPGYAFLSYYKVIESQFKKGRQKGTWIEDTYPTLAGEAGARISSLQATGADVGSYLRDSCRAAVSHAAVGETIVNPDIPGDRVRLQKDIEVIRELARHYICEVLKVPTHRDAYLRMNRLTALHGLLPPDQVHELSKGGSILKKRCAMNGLELAVGFWPDDPASFIGGMTFKVIAAHNGVVVGEAVSASGALALTFVFSFLKGRVDPDIESSHSISDWNYVSENIALIEFRKRVLLNGIVELRFKNAEPVLCELVMPVNIDVPGTVKNWDAQIEGWRNGMQS